MWVDVAERGVRVADGTVSPLDSLCHEHLWHTTVAPADKLILGEQPSMTHRATWRRRPCNRPRTVLARDNGYSTHIDLEVTAVENADVTETPTQIGDADDSTHRNLPMPTDAIVLQQPAERACRAEIH